MCHGLLRNACIGVVLLGFCAGASAQQSAQNYTGPENPPITNLQILDKSMSREDIVALMFTYNEALGVFCDHCHVDVPAGAPTGFVRASRAEDGKATKRIGRVMIKMTADLNAKLSSELGKLGRSGATEVKCITCHRGVTKPRQLTDILTTDYSSGGTAAALREYRDLRQKYYGGQSYDFSERALITVAGRLVDDGKLDDAMKLLDANLEMFPKSASTYVAMAEVYVKKNDKASAIKMAKMGLELDPKSTQVGITNRAGRLLGQLGEK